jgi:hypothetical protein
VSVEIAAGSTAPSIYFGGDPSAPSVFEPMEVHRIVT